MNGEMSTVITENDEEISTAISARAETPAWRPVPGIRLIGVIFGICLYMSLAAVYFLSPRNPVFSLGEARFTIDALLEITFTFLALPAFGIAYFYGVRHFEANQDFAVPEFAIEVMFVVAIIWVAIGNGIHLTAKLDEQLASALDDRGLGIKANFHWIRQVAGHVIPHMGWQVLFAALMLGQIKRPYRRKALNPMIVTCGVAFGILFAQGAIAGSCTRLGFFLTVASCLTFSYLAYKSKLLPGEIPIQRFFFTSQITFLLTIVVYWAVKYAALV
jgi:hypothetical protein